MTLIALDKLPLIYNIPLGWSEVAMCVWLTSATADFESGEPIQNAQITHSFLSF
jgi:hypothetical protein